MELNLKNKTTKTQQKTTTKTNTQNKQPKTHSIQQGVTALFESKSMKLEPLKAQCNN